MNMKKNESTESDGKRSISVRLSIIGQNDEKLHESSLARSDFSKKIPLYIMANYSLIFWKSLTFNIFPSIWEPLPVKKH